MARLDRSGRRASRASPRSEGDGRCWLSRSCARARSATCTCSTTAGCCSSLRTGSRAFDVVLPSHDPGQGPGAHRALPVLVRARPSRSSRTTCSARPRSRSTADAAEIYATGTTRGVRAARRHPRSDHDLPARRRVVPIEAVVRGYLAGSGWKEYRERGTVCGIPLPPGLRESDQLPGADLHPGDEGRAGRARREHHASTG